MRAFLGMEVEMAFGFDPPRPPPRAGGVCVQPNGHGDVAPPPVPLVFNIIPSKKFLTFCLPSCNIRV